MKRAAVPAGRERPRYRTWIRLRRLAGLWAGALVLIGLAGLGALWPPLWLLGIPGLALFASALVPSLSAWQFADRGGGLQKTIHALLMERLPGTGAVLDIGCGNGHFLIKLCQARPGLRGTGLDAWGSDWEYSAEACRRNARLEGVDSVVFMPGSAAALPFAAAAYDSVASCLSFHEVKGIPDRLVCLEEALRVLKPGGRFAFLDLFADPRHFPDRPALLARLAAAGAREISWTPVGELLDLPWPASSPRALGHAVLLCGVNAP